MSDTDDGILTVAGTYSDAVFSGDGSRMFAVSGGNTVYVIDVASGSVITQYTVGTSLGAVDVWPSGGHIVLTERYPGQSGTVYSLDLTTGSIATFTTSISSGAFHDVSFLPDGRVLVSQQAIGNGSTPLRLLDLTTGQFTIIPGPSLPSAILTASIDGSQTLVQPFGWPAAYVYEAGAGFVAQNIVPGPIDPYAGASLPSPTIAGQTTSPDGSFHVQGSTMNVFDSSLNQVANLGALAGAQGITFSADGARLYVAGGSTIAVYNTSNWQLVGTYDAGGPVRPAYDYGGGTHTGFGDILQASPDGRYLSVITSTGIQLIDLTEVSFISTLGDDTMSGEGTLYGLAGDDDLSGIGTYVYMVGGLGDDTYHITGFNDRLFEQANEGHDTVHSVISYSLESNVEDLFLEGTASYGNGNDLDNLIVGNGSANSLRGGYGNDHLQGGDGDDGLEGGWGDDLLVGGSGADTASYNDSSLSGVTVDLRISGPQDTMGAGVDTLVSIENLSGSFYGDRLIGNSEANRLEGGYGNDTLTGGLGSDDLRGGEGADTFIDTAAGLNGDTVDFTAGDAIIISDADISNFSFNITGNVLTYTGGSLTLQHDVYGQINAYRAVGGGVQLQVGPIVGAMDQIAGQLTEVYWGGDNHHFNVTQGGTITVNITDLTSAEKILARAALSSWADVTGVQFVEVNTGGQIVFINDEEPGGPVAYAESIWENGIISSSTIHISTSWVTEYGSGLGTYSHQTYLHEIGHALGLGHSGNYNEEATYPGDISFWNDSWSASVMSYFAQNEVSNNGRSFSFAYAVTPMQADILAMQELYGLSSTTRGGNTVYGYNSTAGSIYNAVAYPGIAYTIYDTGGTDTLDYSGSSAFQLINLNAETFSDVLGLAGNVSIARGVIIENAISGNGYDTIIGNSANNVITGGLGQDRLTGGDGNDTFRDTKAGLNTDIIYDFAVGDRIVITDATLNGFTYNLNGTTLTYTGGSLTLSAPISGPIVASAAAGGGVQLTLTIPDVRNDFNGDGRSDVLWRSEDGQMTNWLAQQNGGFADNSANAGNGVPTAWSIVGTGDFNGDGRDDVLWRNSDGQMTNWLGQANGGYVNNSTNGYAVVSTNWQVVGIGDFNGDGRDDIAFRSTGGGLTNWLGTTTGGYADNSSSASTSVGTSWTIVGTGDFNGDGRDDILWRHSDGSLTNWLGQANGSLSNNAAASITVATSWHIVGTGDFNGDGRDDILWRNENGDLTNWLAQANGSFVNNPNASVWVATSWHIAGVGDYNGDGRDDILWRNDNGDFASWTGQVNGGFVNNPSASVWVPVNWDVQAHDYTFG